MDLTPTKPSLSVDPYSPPREDHDDEKYLVGSLSTLKIHHGAEHALSESLGRSFSPETTSETAQEETVISMRAKRERFTVEGSPFIGMHFKRQDVLPTPAKALFATELHSPLAIKPSVSFAFAQKEKERERDEPKQEEAQPSKEKALYSSRLFVICSASDEHDTGNHQENAQRTALLCGPQGCLRRAPLLESVEWIDVDDLPMPPITDLLRVHEFPYLNHLENKCSGANTESLPPFYAPDGLLDNDTPLVAQSYNAAKRFCSAAMAAVDKVMQQHDDDSVSESVPSVLVIGRPPGHHAGPDGCVPSSTFWRRPDMTSSGFCLLNAVSVAAAYARYNYGRSQYGSSSQQNRAPRIAIVDIDVHHGNGTEEIVRNLTPHTTYLPLPSSWAPMSKLSYKPWLNDKDSEEVFFSSIHLFAGEQFYPGSGHEKENSDRIVNVPLTPLEPGPWSPQLRGKLTAAKREALCHQASEEFREKVSRMLLPKLDAFQPDLLFISAGFDTHHDDFYHYLTEDDIHWITHAMREIVRKHRGLGVISVLEGGYSLCSVPQHTPSKTQSSVVQKSGDNSYGTRGKSKKAAVATSTVVNNDTGANKFAQENGDGGLVKGILAHAAALVGKQSWV